MISYDEALRLVLGVAEGRTLQVEEVPLAEAPARVAGAEIFAPRAIPPFDNAAMDGFAVRLADLSAASSSSPVVLRCHHVTAAGDSRETFLEPGTCHHVMTGAPLPRGTEAIVPIEQTRREGEAEIVFSAHPPSSAHIRLAGSDFQKGEVVLSRGRRLRHADILPLATLGIGRVSVYRKPRVVFLSTGKELVTDLSQPLPPGHIYNANLPYGLAMIAAMGAVCLRAETLPDDARQFEKILHDINEEQPDLVISSGAVSAGEFDFIRPVLESQGGRILFHKIKIKPGKPNLFAVLPGGVPYFGLPGNPIATMVGLRFLVFPYLRKILSQPFEASEKFPIHGPMPKTGELQMFLKARLEKEDDGTRRIRILDGQESFRVSPVLAMNAWAVLPPYAETLPPETPVSVFSLYGNGWDFSENG